MKNSLFKFHQYGYDCLIAKRIFVKQSATYRTLDSLHETTWEFTLFIQALTLETTSDQNRHSFISNVIYYFKEKKPEIFNRMNHNYRVLLLYSFAKFISLVPDCEAVNSKYCTFELNVFCTSDGLWCDNVVDSSHQIKPVVHTAYHWLQSWILMYGEAEGLWKIPPRVRALIFKSKFNDRQHFSLEFGRSAGTIFSLVNQIKHYELLHLLTKEKIYSNNAKSLLDVLDLSELYTVTNGSRFRLDLDGYVNKSVYVAFAQMLARLDIEKIKYKHSVVLDLKKYTSILHVGSALELGKESKRRYLCLSHDLNVFHKMRYDPRVQYGAYNFFTASNKRYLRNTILYPRPRYVFHYPKWKTYFVLIYILARLIRLVSLPLYPFLLSFKGFFKGQEILWKERPYRVYYPFTFIKFPISDD
ncbi:hypothetical protein N9W76_00730 [Planktomarina temperata]|nr:hypothetical protein [Planktomarina temperata]